MRSKALSKKWRGPDALVNTGLFVLLTIQAGLSTVRGAMRQGRTVMAMMPIVCGAKNVRAIEYLMEHMQITYTVRCTT